MTVPASAHRQAAAHGVVGSEDGVGDLGDGDPARPSIEGLEDGILERVMRPVAQSDEIHALPLRLKLGR